MKRFQSGGCVNAACFAVEIVTLDTLVSSGSEISLDVILRKSIKVLFESGNFANDLVDNRPVGFSKLGQFPRTALVHPLKLGYVKLH